MSGSYRLFAFTAALAAFGLPVLAAPSLTSGGPVNITATQLEVQHTLGKAAFIGNVVVTQGDFTLKAPKLSADYNASGAGSGDSLKQLQATGGVVITRGGAGGVTETATGDVATYNPGAQQLVLTGPTVTLTRGPSTLVGDKLVYNLSTGNAQVTNSAGPVKARFVTQSPPAK
jgi:lipopolysaccharide export system protein LptA